MEQGSGIEIQDRSGYKQAMKDVLTLDPAHTVVLTIDMQREYLDQEVGFTTVVPEESARVLGHAEDLLDFARAEGMPVIHVYVARRPDEMEGGSAIGGLAYTNMSRQHDISQRPHGGASRQHDRMVGSPQSEVPARLVKPGDLHVTTKKTIDSYLHTELDWLLSKVHHADAVVLTGINTDTCVYATTIGTANRGYKPVVISDCVASSRGRDSHLMALELMSRSIAWVLTVDEFKTKIRQSSPALAAEAPVG